MSKIALYSIKLIKPTAIKTPEVLDEKINMDLLAQAIHVSRARSHSNPSKVKTRGEVSRTKAKAYKQKGTGRARHGARSAPIFVGGGKAHGPDGLKRVLTLPKKMRRKALRVALSVKREAGTLFLVKDLSALKTTNDASKFLSKLLDKKNSKFTVVLAKKNAELIKKFRNIESVKRVDTVENINASAIYLGSNIVFDNDIFKSTK